MQTIHAENVNWTQGERGVKEAEIFMVAQEAEDTRIDLVEVAPGGYIPPHRHQRRREFITVLLSAGAQMQIGDRIFRPTAGQVFHREPQDILALTNDTEHPIRYSVTRFRYQENDVEWISDDE